MRVYTKWLIFKSCRGIEKPWLVFSPSERLTAPRANWDKGFATWNEAFAFVSQMERAR